VAVGRKPSITGNWQFLSLAMFPQSCHPNEALLSKKCAQIITCGIILALAIDVRMLHQPGSNLQIS
jgi:hypothetical protein